MAFRVDDASDYARTRMKIAQLADLFPNGESSSGSKGSLAHLHGACQARTRIREEVRRSRPCRTFVLRRPQLMNFLINVSAASSAALK